MAVRGVRGLRRYTPLFGVWAPPRCFGSGILKPLRARRFTVEAQAQLERDGALRQRRLGTLGTVDSAGATEAEPEEEEAEEKPVKEKE